MPIADVNGTTLYYSTEGSGPPCLVLHGGLGVDHTIYERTLTPLAGRLQLIFYDHRGNGRSGRPALSTLTMEQWADDAAALLDHLGIERAFVFGHSFGGFIAQEFALRHPDRLLGLMLVDTTPGQLGTGEQADEEQGEPPPEGFLAALQSAPATDEEYEGVMKTLMQYFCPFLGESAGALFDGTIFCAATQVRGMEVLGGWSSVDRLASVHAPTLAIAGSHDVATSAAQSFRIAKRVPGAEVVVVQDAGHFPWLEQPETFFAAIDAWLDTIAMA
jgi:proline iminopeptidase